MNRAFFNYYHKDIRSTFYLKYNFEYLELDKELYLNNMILSEYTNTLPALKYAGLKYINGHFEKKEIISKLMEYFENQEMIGIEIDSFYLPWNPYYKKINRSHMILVYGIDKSKECVYVYDIYLAKEHQILSFENLIDGFIGYFYYIEKPDLEVYTLEDVVNEIYKMVSSTDRRSYLARYFNKVQNIDFCIEKKDFVDSYEFNLTNTYIWWSRWAFTEFFNMVSEQIQTKLVKEICSNLTENTTLWKNYRNNICKNVISRRNNKKDKLFNIGNDIMNIETQVIEQISELNHCLGFSD